ncbi:MAG: hypothetical protein H5T38_07560, partial [Methanobacteriaceae archaeon]|nr:hypothetical protein [Methanobacteriaceae archaeon]
KRAKEHNVPVIDNESVTCTIKRMLSFIRECCKLITLKHSVDKLPEVIDIVIRKYGGRIVDVAYYIPGFAEPLKREVNVYDPREAQRFLDRLQSNPKRKRDLERLYKLSNNIHSHIICAPDKETLTKITQELDKRGLIYKGEDDQQ